MVLFNYSTKELTAKVVYYGPGLCGKTTNLHWIHEKLPIKNKGKMLSLATETDRTLFFDFLPIEIGTIRGMKTRIQLYTVPGQVFYNATRRMVLKGADCVVFVCDSQEPMLDANLESFENMRQNLEANEIDAEEIPLVFQYNKRDLPNALPIEILNERMNTRESPFYEAVAVKGQGVEETLKGVTKLVFKSLSARYGEGLAGGPTPSPGAPSGTPIPALKATPPAAPPPAAPAPLPTAASPPTAAPPPPATPSPPPRPPKVATATIPPAAARPAHDPADEFLEELDLEPEAPEFEVPAYQQKPHTTLVTGKKEAEDLRRRIGMPAQLEGTGGGTREDVQEQDELEEILFEETSLSDLEEAAAAAPAPRAPSPPTRGSTSQPVATMSAGAMSPATLTLDVEPGQGEITVPVEVELPPGSGPVTLNLKIILRPRR